MKERIQKWLENHLVRCEYTEFGWQECHRYEFDEHEIKEFTELIIKECARLCNNFDVHYADNSPLKREIALETAHDLADMILEHFEENI